MPVWVVGRVDDLLRADEPVEAEQVERAPDGRVEEDAGFPTQAVGQRGKVGYPGMRDDQLCVVAVDEVREVVRDRRQTAAAMDQDRYVAFGGELEHRREPLVGEQELLRPRMELDAARAAVHAACCLLDRFLVHVEANERNEPAVAPGGELECAVVAGAEARMAIGLVEAEHEGPGNPVLLHPALKVFVDADHTVDVGA